MPYEKSRLVVQAFGDQGKDEVLTQSPTIQRASQRLILCIAPMWPDRSICVRDISQAYVNAATQLNREIFVWAPEGSGMDGKVLKVLRPLYGIPESGNHWFGTYHRHHTDKLHLRESTFDPCLLTSNDAIVGLQTDDTLICGSKRFLDLEQQQLCFPAKDREMLAPGKPLTFNGATITQNIEGSLELTQRPQQGKIALLKPSDDFERSVAPRTGKGRIHRLNDSTRGRIFVVTCRPNYRAGSSRCCNIEQMPVMAANRSRPAIC